MKKDRVAGAISLAIVSVVFAAIAAWFISLVPGAIDRELDAADAKVAAHLQLLKGGDK